MLTFHAQYLHHYQALIDEELNRIMEILTSNHSITDFSTYKYQLGILDGLKKAAELSQEADAIANGRDQQGE
jgi:hypothetical protein